MELESGVSTSQKNPAKLSWVNLSKYLLLAYQSFGVVYGDLSTSPLYVYTSTLSGKLQNHRHEEVIFGIFSLIFWTLTLIPLLKYAVIILNVDDNGEGGTFALYSLLCRHANFSLLPNQQAADEELSCYKNGLSLEAAASSSLKRFLENHRSLKTALLVMMLLGACMVIGDGVFSPAISSEVVLIACVILVGLFALQRYGTHKVVFVFAPFFIKTGKEGWISLGGMLLCITGTEAMFADIGHFTTVSIRTRENEYASFKTMVLGWPCLYDGYVCDYISDGTSHNVCLAEKHSDSYNIPFVLLGDRGCISICSIGKSVSRRMGSSCLIFHLYACNVCVALWHLYQVQLRPMQQSFIEMVTGFGPYSLIYTELATGIPAIFSHFVTNLPAFHMVLFFVCVKTVPVPHVSHEERYLIWRVCRRPCQMYRCTVRYGYKHIRRDDRDFGNHIIRCIAEFIQMEAQELQLSFSETSSFDGGTAIISVRSLESVSSWKVSENEDVGVDKNNASGRSFSVRRPLSTYNEENPHSRRRHISFRVPNDPVLDHEVKQELLDLAQTMEAGVQLWLLTFLTSVSLKLE
ncbi:hypothetical protein JHK85_003543 [Glycine max]|nr:hypothetical protein JHK85_003543 [Glycine max]